MRVRPHRNGLYQLLGGGVDDSDRFVALITHIGKAPINGKGNASWSTPHWERPEDAIVRGVDDRDVILNDIGQPGIAIVLSQCDHMAAVPSGDRGNGLEGMRIDH